MDEGAASGYRPEPCPTLMGRKPRCIGSRWLKWKDPVTNLSRRTCAKHKAAENKWSSKVSQEMKMQRKVTMIMLLFSRTRFLNSWECLSMH